MKIRRIEPISRANPCHNHERGHGRDEVRHVSEQPLNSNKRESVSHSTEEVKKHVSDGLDAKKPVVNNVPIQAAAAEETIEALPT